MLNAITTNPNHQNAICSAWRVFRAEIAQTESELPRVAEQSCRFPLRSSVILPVNQRSRLAVT